MYPDNTHIRKQFIVPANDIYYSGQTNHDAWFIPECVCKYKGHVRRNRIAGAFYITARRVSQLLNKKKEVDGE